MLRYLSCHSQDGKIIRIGIEAPRDKKIVRESEIERYYTPEEVRLIQSINRRQGY